MSINSNEAAEYMPVMAFQNSTFAAQEPGTGITANAQFAESEHCVPQLVALQAALHPDAPALSAGVRTLSYGELNERANQLARLLQALGVGPGVLVGVCVERSAELAIALLGVLKAGGAYVPLDPAYPRERLHYMLQDSGAPVLVTRQLLQDQLNLRLQGVQTICLDSDAALLSQQESADPLTSVQPDDLIYVIYTSGSTGQPKGVQITHRSFLNLAYWHLRAFEVSRADRATQVTSPAFDATGWELWPYLIAGASIHLPGEETRVSPAVLRDWLLEQRITITFLPTVLAESLLQLDWPATTSLRYLLTGADALHLYPPANLPFALINNYGPTEATVVATSGRILPTQHADAPPSIGRPIAGTQVYVLDEDLRPVPDGEIGELYIGGAGLARGYLNRPELTAERFISYPGNVRPATRLYKTGDLVRLLLDGQIAFLGRADQQIKIRGYRIEPGEIEAALLQDPAVHQAIVVAREDQPGEKRLVAYLVPHPGTEVAIDALRTLLSQRLPDYMLPAAFVRLETTPLTPNGKIDRAALPAPDETNMLREETFQGPSTSPEQRLTEIVAALLGMEPRLVAVDDNFFMLGGHSLLGTQMIARVSETFGVDLTLRVLFESPTVRQLAAEIERLVLLKIETMSDEDIQRLLQ